LIFAQWLLIGWRAECWSWQRALTFTHLDRTTAIFKSLSRKYIANMTKFRPCIDLHAGAVKQIIGGTLTTTSSDLQTNFTSEHGAAFYADLYKKYDLRGGHVIMLGPGNDEASKEALTAWPSGLQVGGGIKDSNAQYWIDAGAEKVGKTTLLFVFLSLGALRVLCVRITLSPSLVLVQAAERFFFPCGRSSSHLSSSPQALSLSIACKQF
jgi:hypothetical protein